MHRSLSAAVLAASLALTHPASAGTADSLSRAREYLGRNDARSASVVLEDALSEAGPDRAAVLDLLRQSYESAARQAEAAGKTQEAEAFRDNLEILNRKTPPAPVTPNPVPKPESTPKPPDPAPTESIPKSDPKPEPKPEATPGPAPTPAPTGTAAIVAAADGAFRSQRYDEAGRLYATLDHDGKLPPTRRDHWAYCRLDAVRRRINAKPASDQEWSNINAELEKIHALSPKIWVSHYLKNVAAERSGGASRRASTSNKVVVRGAGPDEPPPTLLAATDPETARTPLLAVAPRPAQGGAAPAQEPAPQPAPNPAPGKWLVHETANFRILHADDELAEKVGAAAEAARAAQVKRWAAPAEDWAPKCDIYLYPTARIFSRMTGQPEDSPGFSTMGMNSGRITARRVNLRADHENVVKSILPHEVTHVVLADLFPRQQIPRWADEGIAVLAEPKTEQRLRAADLEEPLSTGKLFRVEELMAMDYPDGRYWGLYYAQSVSLTRFLVEQGTPDQFIKFVAGSQRAGPEAALNQVYKIDGCADLHRRWISYAQDQMKQSTAKAETAESTRRE